MSKEKKIRIRCCIRLLTTAIVLLSIILMIIYGAVSVESKTYTISQVDDLTISIKNC